MHKLYKPISLIIFLVISSCGARSVSIMPVRHLVFSADYNNEQDISNYANDFAVKNNLQITINKNSDLYAFEMGRGIIWISCGSYDTIKVVPRDYSLAAYSQNPFIDEKLKNDEEAIAVYNKFVEGLKKIPSVVIKSVKVGPEIP